MNLRDVPVGQSARVVKLHGLGPVRRRIMDMGITKGQVIRVIKVAPLGDPMEITVRGYELSVRKADCEMIEVEAVDANAKSVSAHASAPAAAVAQETQVAEEKEV